MAATTTGPRTSTGLYHQMESIIAAFSRDKFNSHLQRVIFLAASDDPYWLRANLKADLGDLFFTADLFSSGRPSGGQDLALLSLCQHSIIGVARPLSLPQEDDDLPKPAPSASGRGCWPGGRSSTRPVEETTPP